LAHANHRAGDDDEDVPRARLVFVVVVAGVSDAYARASAEKMAVKITAMSVHTSRVVVVVMSNAPVGVSCVTLARGGRDDFTMSGKALASDSEDDDVPTNASPAVKRETDDAGDAKPAAKKVRATRVGATKVVTDDGHLSNATQVKKMSGAEGKKPAKDDDDDGDDDGDSDADSVDSECVDDLSGDEVDVSNIIEGGRRARRGRPTTFDYAKAGPAFGSDSDDE